MKAFFPAPPISAPHCRRGFTLIELLTVIAIIGILAAILIPTVAAVRDSAKAAVCSSNIRQISMALLMFADEHDGRLPTIGDAEAKPTDWIQWRDDGRFHDLRNSAIVPYISGAFTPDLFRCPSDQNVRDSLSNPISGWVPYAYSYTLNSELSERAQLGGIIHNVEDSTLIVMLVEEKRPNDSAAYLNSDLDDLTERHGGEGHVSFVDGHVEKVHPDFVEHPQNHNPFYRGRPYTGPR